MADNYIVDFNVTDGLTPQQIEKLNYNFHLLAGGATAQNQQGVEISQRAQNAYLSAETAQKNAQDSAQYAHNSYLSARESELSSIRSANAAEESERQSGISAAAAEESQRQANLSAAAASASAASANESAAQARRSAKYSNSALDQLSIVQDVVGVLQWAVNNGDFVQATEHALVDNRVYYEYNSQSGDYEPVIMPDDDADPAVEGWYWLDPTESMKDYMLAHLAFTSRGLWVLPAGPASSVDLNDKLENESDEDAAARLGRSYKMLLSSSGVVIYDDYGVAITSLGQSIRFNDAVPQYIGGEDAFIMYYDSDNDDIPDSLLISGDNVTVGNLGSLSDLVTLNDLGAVQTELQNQISGEISTWFTDYVPTNNNYPANNWTSDKAKNQHLGDLCYNNLTGVCYRYSVDNGVYSWVVVQDNAIVKAIQDSAEAKQIAEDVPIVTLSSTNGTVFKRNIGVSTTIVATIFTPGGRIDNIADLHSRFGNGAYLEWGWRDVVTDANHVLLNSDSRIGNNGFSLTVNPEDIDTQAVITCSLMY